MIFFTNNNAIFVCFTRYTYQYYCSNLTKEEYQSAISVSAGMSLTYFASTVLSTSTKKTKPLCLQVGEHDLMPGISDQSCQILSSITMFQLCHAKFAY